jgi:hypothetical protein
VRVFCPSWIARLARQWQTARLLAASQSNDGERGDQAPAADPRKVSPSLSHRAAAPPAEPLFMLLRDTPRRPVTRAGFTHSMKSVGLSGSSGSVLKLR